MRLFNDVLFFFFRMTGMTQIFFFFFSKYANTRRMNDKSIKNYIKENKLVKNWNPLI